MGISTLTYHTFRTFETMKELLPKHLLKTLLAGIPLLICAIFAFNVVWYQQFDVFGVVVFLLLGGLGYFTSLYWVGKAFSWKELGWFLVLGFGGFLVLVGAVYPIPIIVSHLVAFFLFIAFYRRSKLILSLNSKQKRRAILLALLVLACVCIILILRYDEQISSVFSLMTNLYKGIAAVLLFLTLSVSLLSPKVWALRMELSLMVLFSVGTLLGVEYYLYFFSPHIDSSQRIASPYYLSPYSAKGADRYNGLKPNREIRYSGPEFDYYRKTNHLGLTDPRISDVARKCAILCLGDSFTEGFGVPYDSSWVQVAERKVNEQVSGIEFLNAGNSGSDPFFHTVLYNEKLNHLDAKVVIMALNYSDLSEVITRRGRKRFVKENVKYSPSPRYEALFASSYLAKIITKDALNYNELLIPKQNFEKHLANANAIILEELKTFGTQLKANGATLVVVINPILDELLANEYLLHDWPNTFKDFNLIDLLALSDKTRAQSIYYPLDGHYNTKGYNLMGEAIAEWLIENEMFPCQD